MIVIILAIIVLLIILFLIFFNRDPERNIPQGRNIVSPADGKIIEIIDLSKLKKKDIEVKKGLTGKIKTETEDITKNGYLVSIFMNLGDVHVQRAPVDGKVIFVEYKKGKFIPANKFKAFIENEKIEIVIKNKKLGKIKVIQAAGLIARRVVCFKKKNETLLKGQRIGKIKLGSQVVLIIPRLKLSVKKEDRVTAGETVIAKY